MCVLWNAYVCLCVYMHMYQNAASETYPLRRIPAFLEINKADVCLGAKVTSKAWPLIFLELSKVLEKQWPVLTVFQPTPPPSPPDCLKTSTSASMDSPSFFMFHTKKGCFAFFWRKDLHLYLAVDCGDLKCDRGWT